MTCLVVENDPTAGLGHFAEWLADGGLALSVVRAHAGEAVPENLAGYGALLVLGGHQHAYADPVSGSGDDGSASAAGLAPAAGSAPADGLSPADGSAPADGAAPAEPRPAWFSTVEALLRQAVRERVPALGICLGAQLLATAHNGTVAPAAAGPEIGPGLVAKRDAAETDPLFGPLPMLPDVLQWHQDEVTELPLGAVLLATSTAYPVQAFRLGPAAWGVQFHPEADLPTFQRWIDDNLALLDRLNLDPAQLAYRVALHQDDLFEAWHPFAIRFAALATGELAVPNPGRGLPVLGS